MHKTHGTMLLAALCLMCMPVVFGGDCAPYVGSDFTLYSAQSCGILFCAGTCTQRYCSILPGTELDQSQFMCILNNLYFVIGCGIIISLLVVGGIIACCCKSQSHVTSSVTVANVVRHRPMVQMPYSTPVVGYMPVANQSMYAGHCPPQYPGADNKAFEETP